MYIIHTLLKTGYDKYRQVAELRYEISLNVFIGSSKVWTTDDYAVTNAGIDTKVLTHLAAGECARLPWVLGTPRAWHLQGRVEGLFMMIRVRL